MNETAERLLFLGSKQLGLRVLTELADLFPQELVGIVTIDDTNDTRSAYRDFERFANGRQLELEIARTKADADSAVRSFAPDLCLVVGWYWLISEQMIRSVPRGFLGIHNSILPKYRGVSPLVWSIIAGEPEVGVSLFTIGPGMDDGPIWAQSTTKLRDIDYIGDVLARLEHETIEIVRRDMPRIIDGSVKPRIQDHEKATYCAARMPDDGNVDWAAHARHVYNFIRAQSDPYPGAFTYLGPQELRIWRAKQFDGIYMGTPGQVAQIMEDGVCVTCGSNTAVVLQEVEYDGQRAPATSVLRSTRTRLSRAPAPP